MASNTNPIIILKDFQTQFLFWSRWVLANTITVAGVTAIAVATGYIPPAVVGWIAVGVSLGLIQQWLLDRYVLLNHWGWATALGWLIGVPLGKTVVGWQATGWDLDWALVGLCLGLTQMLILRQQFQQAGWWVLASSTGLVLASALGGATSLLEDWLAYKGMIFIEESLARSIGWILAAAVGGAANGAVTGGWLLWFLGTQTREYGPDSEVRHGWGFGTPKSGVESKGEDNSEI